MTQNRIHPELLAGEMFLTNSDEEGYEKIGYKTKRKGTQTFDRSGNPFSTMDFFPVFVKTEEYEKVQATV